MYKALMLDVDGTLVPYDYQALPSDKVAAAVRKAQEYVHVSLVTGRAFPFIQDILKKLEIRSGFAVVNNGAQVIELETGELIYDQPIELEDAKAIIAMFRMRHIPFYLKQEEHADASDRNYFQVGDSIVKPYMFFTDEVYSLEEIESLVSEIPAKERLYFHKGHHKEPDKYNINISHVNATKLHGIEMIMKQRGLTREAIIGVGDGYNDFPLLMGSGLKVAMGNAIPDLKEIADFIAPTVTDDGVATIIETFILPRN